MNAPDDLARHGARLASVARAILRSPHDADDAVQDAWVAALEGRVAPASEPVSWLRAVVRNLARARARARHSAERVARDAAREPAEPAEPADAALARSEAALALARAIHALPAAERDVIVRRYWDGESAGAIAAALGIPRKRVSNLHQRALARLRARLLRRSDLLPALAVLAEPRRSLLPTVLVMPKAAAVAVAVALALLAISIPVRLATPDVGPRELATLAPAREAVTTSSPGSSAAPLVDATDRIALEAPETTMSDARGPAAVPAPGRELPEPAEHGDVRVVAIDGTTGAPVESLLVRMASEGRTTERTRPGAEHRTSVEPGTWDVTLIVPRLDVHAIEGVLVESGRTTDLGRIVLYPGSARLAGIVHATRADEPLAVALYGIGRNPCIDCTGADERAAPCALCGWSPARSVRSVAGGETFAFDALAAGSYHLVVARADLVLATRALEIAAGASEWIDVDLAFGDLALVLLDAGGAPFPGAWSEDGGARFSGPIRAFFQDAQGVSCGAAVAAPWEDVVPVATPYALEPGEQLLRQELPGPDVRSAPLALRRGSAGHLEALRVPRDAASVLVACGPFFAIRELTDQSWLGEPVEVHLVDRCSLPSDLLQSATSCTSCHALPSDVIR